MVHAGVKELKARSFKARSVSVVRLLVIAALIALALLQVAADLAALMVTEAADELALSTGKSGACWWLGAALFMLATPTPADN